jgi:murein L,D-transpeptidase YcbB/YkuD
MVTALFSVAGPANRLILAILLLFFGAPGLAQDAPPQSRPPAAPTPPPPAPAQPATPAASALQALLKESALPKLRWGQFSDHQAALETLYQASGYAPLWTRNGKPTPQALKAIANLSKADDQGLDSADYDPELWQKWQAELAAAPTPAPRELASFDAGLSLSLMRYVSNLYMGRINPKRVNFSLDIEPKKLDLPALLRKLAASDNPDALIAAQEPKLKFYGYLKTALARYRQLAKDAPAVQISLPAKFKPGDRHADVPKLRKLLAVLGDLTGGDGNDPSQAYDPPLADAVKRFQSRHGLAPDAVIGKGTLAQLNVPLAERVKQIRLGLERLRWLPDQIDGRYLMVNIPSFQLFGFHTGSGSERPDLEMNVIVGEAIDGHSTPVFHSDMTYVNFRPYWNVPYAITVKEYVPILSRNPGYLAGHDMEIVSSFAPDAAVYGASRGNIQQLASGALKLRQRPGPKNALGLVKFAFPNTNNVYLHSTPSQGLFKRSRRDFSHGCIRVEFPATLAEFVLKDHGDWTREKIEEAMQADKPKIVTLKPSIPVYIFYSTVLADADGKAMFYQDLYGHDAPLNAELAKGFPYPS